MNILAIGLGGNLGSYFSDNSIHKVSLQKVVRDEFLLSEFTIAPEVEIKLPKNYFPDLIINFANSYFPSPNSSQVEKMKAAIVGVSESIAKTSSIYSVPVISFSSYFQYPPLRLRPWSAYSLLKDQGIEILRNSSNNFIEITLGDNYGGKRRDKFFDVALLSNLQGTQLDANPGDSLLNLLHLSDICRGIDQIISNLSSFSGHHHFELRSQCSQTLREIVSIIDSERGNETKVNWGAIPYREKEVFEDWKCGEALEGWQSISDLRSYIRNFTN